LPLFVEWRILIKKIIDYMYTKLSSSRLVGSFSLDGMVQNINGVANFD
jgi:hypothetical protein